MRKNKYMRKFQKFRFTISTIKNSGFALIISALFLFSACMSVADGAGRLLDGTVSNHKKIAKYKTSKNDNNDTEIMFIKNKEGGQSISINLKNYSMINFYGTIPEQGGLFRFTSLEYCAGNTHGWNEFTLDIMGSGNLSLEGGVILKITEIIEPVEISKGRIQRYDTRITGNDALTALRNRRERIVSAVNWMKSFENAPQKQDIKNFEKYWKPYLFPELVSKKSGPTLWRQDGDEFSKAEDINWNTSYSKRTFPEELWTVRNSGTLLRDWEEALPWLYYEYEWENIQNLLSVDN